MANNPNPYVTAAVNRRITQPQTMNAPYGNVYSLAEIQTDAGITAFTVKASPALLSHCAQQMRETGWLYLFNDAEAISIRADRVVAIKFTQITKD